jgi:hypothetical protein
MADAGGGGGGGVLEPVPSLRTEVESLKRERDRLQDAVGVPWAPMGAAFH